MMSSREYFVINSKGDVSIDPKDAEPEAFATLKAAKKRARVMAQREPGETVLIARSIAQVTCEVKPPTVRERKL